MSSKIVRQQVYQYLSDNIAETVLDMTGRFSLLEDELMDAGIDFRTNWIAIYFRGQGEEAVSVNDEGKGCYREYGDVIIVIVAPARKNIHTYLLDKAEEIRGLLRGKKLGKITLMEADPIDFEGSNPFNLTDGWISAYVSVGYMYDNIIT